MRNTAHKTRHHRRAAGFSPRDETSDRLSKGLIPRGVSRQRVSSCVESHRSIVSLFSMIAISLGHGPETITPHAFAGSPTVNHPVDSKLLDFFQAGSQPTAKGGVQYESFRISLSCTPCHESDAGQQLTIYGPFQGSMMAHSARDPLFYACLTIANQDAAFAGDLCIRCHSPGGWLSGRSEPTDGSALLSVDRDGVSCNVCHRMVDPEFKPGVSPSIDEFILQAIDPLPTGPGGGNYIMDPADFRRGPYSNPMNAGHVTLYSPFHRSPALCGTCHDVSNPMYQRQGNGSYALTRLDARHPTGNKYDMFPLERTYSEWLHSDFADGGVNMQGRFGGTKLVINTCQDCHMPISHAKGCNLGPMRADLAAHDLAGGNAWVQDMVANLYPDDDINPTYLEAGKQRSRDMLARACSLELSQIGNRVDVKIVNETGHKLPSGYPEGRRMWINVKVYDEELSLLQERGRYDPATADLTVEDTKVYESILGVDAAVAAATGIPEGKGFHFAINNFMVKDNRIPPRGFTNAAYRTIQAAPVGVEYPDGQFWDHTRFRLPIGAASVTVHVYYQTSSKEYVTFLRDENHTDQAGLTLYNQWELTGKSPPVLMATASSALASFVIGDVNADNRVNLEDYAVYANPCAANPGEASLYTDCAQLDFDADGDVDLFDFGDLQLNFTP